MTTRVIIKNEGPGKVRAMEMIRNEEGDYREAESPGVDLEEGTQIELYVHGDNMLEVIEI